ncbi:unnamed protein product (macronuclear) [Paramecium tetraurelia]|uniref:Uncharacterized protein n=1 Tax=Paramecium tetraurelia TaxID=5888 RepID=A0C7D5_PARTE|nr:uncharacterized protein GSPATT00035832001 [Paramecium tetraurelia]CAK66702.1 unnamed protein product [Paramecium tetraurelia]|eukprot:XP_001434099.1 hypothetical protein (macronuclear) [Paramecium tetraurelia strain d4-2]
MENQRIIKSVKSATSLNSKQSTKIIQCNSKVTHQIEPNVLIQQHPTQIGQHSAQQNIPPIPLKQVNNILPTRETPIFKQTQEERYSNTKDATCLMAKLDSLREIKSADSPIRSHVSPIPSTLWSVVVPTKNNATKPQLLQQVASSSCVEPFKTYNNNKNVNQTQQLSQTLPQKKTYETMIQQLMNEQEFLVKQYNDKIKILEQKTQELSKQNNNLVEQNQLFLDQNLQLKNEVTIFQQKQYQINYEYLNEDTLKTVLLLEQQLEQKKEELKQLIQNMDEILSINQKTEEKNNELSQQISNILQQKDREINAYFTQINTYKQTIQELELKIAQLIQSDQIQQQILKEAQTKITFLEQSDKNKQGSQLSSQQLKFNVKESFEYKQLVLELDSKCVTITEKENQIETLKIKNQMVQQQLAQMQTCQVTNKDHQEALRQKETENDDLRSQLISKDEEIERLNQQLKFVRKEKAKLSINLMNAGMANLVMLSQSQFQQDEITA